jgi:hypothetical protein
MEQHTTDYLNREIDNRVLQKYLDGLKEHYGMSEKDFDYYRGWVETCHGREVADWQERVNEKV